MYCPQCGTESQSTQYCRTCGANLKVIGKAVALSEAIARSDRGPLPKIKEMVKGLNVDHVTEEVSRAFDRMSQELSEISPQEEPSSKRHRRRDRRPLISLRKKKTPLERREEKITKGIVSMFSGAGLTVFLYYLSAALVLKLPPDVLAKIPFEIDPVVRVLWYFGFIPMLSGVGNIIAGLCIRPRPDRELEPPPFTPPRDLTEGESTKVSAPTSVTERTTNLLEHNY